MEYNERSVAVIFGHFGNRISPQPGALYPTSVDVVSDDSPLQLVGPGGTLVSAVGLSRVVGVALYGRRCAAGQARWAQTRRCKTHPNVHRGHAPRGGPQNLPTTVSPCMAPGAVSAADVHVRRHDRRWCPRTLADGLPALLPAANQVGFGPSGRADRGSARLPRGWRSESGLSAWRTWAETGQLRRLLCRGQRDNYIDIILAGDAAAVAKITTVEDAIGGERPVYNPRWSWQRSSSRVRYSAPSPPIAQPVIVALDDPLTVFVTNAETSRDPG